MTIWSKALRAAGVEPSDDFEGLKAQVTAALGSAGLPSPWFSPDNRHCTSHHKTDQVAKLLTGLASPWFSSNERYCTSDHKRGQVDKVFTGLVDKWWVRGSERRCRILNCMGMRGQESSMRAKLAPFKRDERASNGRRTVDTYLPLFNWTAEEVWADIRASGVPFHRAYSLGMPRLSCCFCIFAPKAALMLAGKHNRSKLDEYVAVEQEVGSRFKVELSLLEVRDALDRGEEPGPVPSWEL